MRTAYRNASPLRDNFCPARLSRPVKLPKANLQARLTALSLTVREVHARLSRMGVDVAYTTVAGWFNGSRGIRDVEHMKALCTALETDLGQLSGGKAELVEEPLDIAISRESRGLTDAQKQALLLMARTMRAS